MFKISLRTWLEGMSGRQVMMHDEVGKRRVKTAQSAPFDPVSRCGVDMPRDDTRPSAISCSAGGPRPVRGLLVKAASKIK